MMVEIPVHLKSTHQCGAECGVVSTQAGCGKRPSSEEKIPKSKPQGKPTLILLDFFRG
jgi:hypothetical protein